MRPLQLGMHAARIVGLHERLDVFVPEMLLCDLCGTACRVDGEHRFFLGRTVGHGSRGSGGRARAVVIPPLFAKYQLRPAGRDRRPSTLAVRLHCDPGRHGRPRTSVRLLPRARPAA